MRTNRRNNAKNGKRHTYRTYVTCTGGKPGWLTYSTYGMRARRLVVATNKQVKMTIISTALRRAALRRVLTAATTSSGARTYHVSAALSADALDMADSFSRRHRKFDDSGLLLLCRIFLNP